MLLIAFYVWLLGATIVFVAVAMAGDASDRTEPLWLLVLAAVWPLVVLVFLVGLGVAMAGRLGAKDR
jgi:asparagine N-glycosylation enzyme membrane subunit Stt3